MTDQDKRWIQRQIHESEVRLYELITGNRYEEMEPIATPHAERTCREPATGSEPTIRD